MLHSVFTFTLVNVAMWKANNVGLGITVGSQFKPEQVTRRLAHDCLKLGDDRFNLVNWRLDHEAVMSASDDRQVTRAYDHKAQQLAAVALHGKIQECAFFTRRPCCG